MKHNLSQSILAWNSGVPDFSGCLLVVFAVKVSDLWLLLQIFGAPFRGSKLRRAFVGAVRFPRRQCDRSAGVNLQHLNTAINAWALDKASFFGGVWSSGWWWLEHEWIMTFHSVGNHNNHNPKWRTPSFFRGLPPTRLFFMGKVGWLVIFSIRRVDRWCSGITYWCVLPREWMGCWGLLGWLLIWFASGSFPKIPCEAKHQ